MVEPDRIRAYAQALQHHSVFLNLVLWYIVSRLQHKILNSDIGGNLIIGQTTINRNHIGHLEQALAEDLKKPEFWEFCAEQILARIDAWEQSGERPPDIGRGGLATGSRNPTPFVADEKETEVRDRYAADAADWLLEQTGLGQLDVAQLEELLGLKAERDAVKQGTSKLSQVQKEILLQLLAASKGCRYTPVPWRPAAWFGEQSDSKRAVISRALKKLEERKLLIRKSSGESSGDKTEAKRTALIELTDLGYLSAKLLTRRG